MLPKTVNWHFRFKKGLNASSDACNKSIGYDYYRHISLNRIDGLYNENNAQHFLFFTKHFRVLFDRQLSTNYPRWSFLMAYFNVFKNLLNHWNINHQWDRSLANWTNTRTICMIRPFDRFRFDFCSKKNKEKKNVAASNEERMLTLNSSILEYV